MNIASIYSSRPAPAFPGAFVGADPKLPIGKNATLLRHAPDVIRALGPTTTIGELRDRFGMSLTKIARLSQAERATMLGAISRGKNAAAFGARLGAGLGRSKHGTKAPRAKLKKAARKSAARKGTVHRGHPRPHRAHAAKKR